jgi:sugar phosphate isomerase/epimerase
MQRRELLGLLLASPLFAKLDRQRLTIIADEAGSTLDSWIEFARKYQLRRLEMRAIERDGHPVMLDSMSPAELKPIAKRLADEGIQVSFLAVAKEDWYENLYARQKLTPEILYRTRNDRFQKALDAAHALGAPMLRSFTFWRVKEPRSLFPRLVELLGPMGEMAAKAGVKMLIETEYATNVATSEEMRDLLLQLKSPAIGVNWDPQNSLELEPNVFPEGYGKLPKKRIWNVQIKAEGLFGKNRLDWGAIFRTLEADGYRGFYGLETHHGHGPENFKMSHRSMDELLRIVSSLQG